MPIIPSTATTTSRTLLAVPPAIKDRINGIRAQGRSGNNTGGFEFTAEALERIDTFLNSLASQVAAVSNAITPNPPTTEPIRMIVPFWFGQGENQPADPALDLNQYDLIFPNDPPITYTTAIWQYANIYNYNSPAPTQDLQIQMYLDGVALFDGSFLVLPNGTAVQDIITATNFAAPSSAITADSKITGRIVATDDTIENIQVNLVFDLVAT